MTVQNASAEIRLNEIDREIKRIVMECYTRAKQVIKKNIKTLHRVATSLLERESLSGEEIEQIIQEGSAA